MSVYLCCPFDCQHKDIARNVFGDLHNAGIKAFYNGDIPDELRTGDAVGGAIGKALVQSPVFIPVLCQGFTGGKSVRELMYAMQLEKCVLPVLVDGHYLSTEMRNLIAGTRIADMSSPVAYNAELPNLIGTLRTLIPVLEANDQSAVSAVSVEVEPDDSEDEAEGWSDEDDDDEDNDEDESAAVDEDA